MKLELRGITKRFGSLVANDHIDLVVQPGEIRALLGENGAGKTTLMNVLYGLVQPDEGEILINDQRVHVRSPKDAIGAGVGMVHQHFMLVPVFTVAENVTLGAEPVRRLALPELNLGPVHVPALNLPWPACWTGGGLAPRYGSCPSASGCASTPTPTSRTCRSACSSGSRSSRRCCATPASWCSTSPRRC